MPLTRKQKWRIDKVQSEKIARADKAASKAESELDDEKEYQGIVIRDMDNVSSLRMKMG